MNEPKICPLLGAGPLSINTNCKEDRCAWAYGDGCVLVAIASALNDLNNNGLVTYPDEVPHEQA